MSANPWGIVECPLVSESFRSGVDGLCQALLEAGLASAIGAATGWRLPRPHWPPRRDPENGRLNPEELRESLLRLADLVQECMAHGHRPLVLGGDCSILLGCLAGARRAGEHGLFFMDGHADYYLPGESPSGEVADMDLSLVTGRGPGVLTGLDGPAPLVEPGRVTVFGFRDGAVSARFGAADLDGSGLAGFSLEDIRLLGFHNALCKGLERHREQGLPLWLHIDLDVLDDAALPAVDYRMPGGLAPGEFVRAARLALDTGLVSGADVTIFNPSLDWDGSQTRLVTALLTAALAD